jgi:hypothetical protein
MRGTVPPEKLKFDPEIEKTARRNNSLKKKKERELAKQKQQEGTSTFIPSLTTLFEEEESMAGNGNGQNPPGGNQSVMPSWTSPRRLAHLGKDKEKQVELKSGTIQLVSNHPFAGLDHEDPYQHLSVFYALANSLGQSEADEEAGFVRLFQHSLIGKARE